MSERFMIDDCGTLIDMTNGNTYDYVSDVCGLLNELHEENKKLKQVNEMLQMDFAMTERNLLEENEQLKQLNIPLGEVMDIVLDYKGRVERVYYND